MNMNFKTYFDDYQEWTKTTAVFPGNFALNYLSLGVCDEASELLEKTVSSTGEMVYPEKASAIAECGDVLWYLAQLLGTLGIKLGDVHGSVKGNDFAASFSGTCIGISICAGKIAGRVKKRIRDGEQWTENQRVSNELDIFNNAARILGGLNAFARALGCDLIDVAEANKTKLDDRKKRKALHGEGDNR